MMLDFKSGHDPRFENPLVRRERVKRLRVVGAISAILPAIALGWLLLPDDVEPAMSQPTSARVSRSHLKQPAIEPSVPAQTKRSPRKDSPKAPGEQLRASATTPRISVAPASAAIAGAQPAPMRARVAAPTEPEKAAIQPAAAKLPPKKPEGPKVSKTRPAAVKSPTKPATKTVRYAIKRGETLASIFKKLGIPKRELHQIVRSGKQARSLANIMPGQELRILFDGSGDLQRLVLQRDPVHSLVVEADDDGGYKTRTERRDVKVKRKGVSGTIASSLFKDARKAGLSDAQVLELAALFNWDIDFALELRAGDSFRVVFEEQYLGDAKYRNGPILAAEFVNRGQVYRAVRFEDDNGVVDYYDPKGHGKRRAFIRTPLKVGRISSRFSMRRWHPVLKRWRSHKGVDYAAPRGTPVKVTGSGKVIFRGRKGGYGNVVIVQHGRKYQTLYAHLNAFSRKVKRGSKVRQGQIIGYVGSTGLATGPHLHYEFRVHGHHRDPLKVKLPKTMRLAKKERQRFKKQAAPLVAMLEAVPSKTMVASAGKSKAKTKAH